MLENNRFFVLENNRFSVLENNRFSVLENNRCPPRMPVCSLAFLYGSSCSKCPWGTANGPGKVSVWADPKKKKKMIQ